MTATSAASGTPAAARGRAVAISVSGLVKTFGPARALDGLDLTVATGEVHGFLGPTGRAKPRRSGCCLACCGPTRARPGCSATG